jgi:hypothetical protein
MIGGMEIRLAIKGCATPLEVAVRAIMQRWPRSVFEDGISGEQYDQFSEIPFRSTSEIFVYRDRNAADIWDAEGAVPAVYNTMIHLISDDDNLTVVVDNHDREIDQIIDDVASELAAPKRS